MKVKFSTVLVIFSFLLGPASSAGGAVLDFPAVSAEPSAFSAPCFTQAALAPPFTNLWQPSGRRQPLREIEMARVIHAVPPVATAKRAGSPDLSDEEQRWLNHQLKTALKGTYLQSEDNDLIWHALGATFQGASEEERALHQEIGYRLHWTRQMSSDGTVWIDDKKYRAPMRIRVMETGNGLLPRNQEEWDRGAGTLGAYARVVFEGDRPRQFQIYIPRNSLDLLKKDNGWRLKKPLPGREELYLRQRAVVQDVAHEIAEFSLGIPHARVVGWLEPLYGLTGDGITYRMARDILDAERRGDTAYLSALQNPEAFVPSTRLRDAVERENSGRMAQALASAARRAQEREELFQQQVSLPRESARAAAKAALSAFKSWSRSDPDKIRRLISQSLIHAVLRLDTEHMQEPMADDFGEMQFTDRELLEFLEMVFDDERTWRRLERALPLIFIGHSSEEADREIMNLYEQMTGPHLFPAISVFMGAMIDRALRSMARDDNWLLSNVVATQFLGPRGRALHEEILRMRALSGIDHAAIQERIRKSLLGGSA